MALVRRRHLAYRAVFTAPDGQRVIEHLAKFCHAYKTTHVIGDPHGSAQLEGRRQVWLLITQSAHLSEGEVDGLIERMEQEMMHG